MKIKPPIINNDMGLCAYKTILALLHGLTATLNQKSKQKRKVLLRQYFFIVRDISKLTKSSCQASELFPRVQRATILLL